MNRHLILTDDGSHSFFVPELDEQYHSTHGAIQESDFVYIKSGLGLCVKDDIVVFEVGFGTGLNALLSLLFAKNNRKNINYLSVEKYPLEKAEYDTLNYTGRIAPELDNVFKILHESSWDSQLVIFSYFSLFKIENDLRKINFHDLPLFDVIFFDAFAPNKQPDLWTDEIYSKLYEHCNKGAILVTYCAKGVVRRGLQQAGFMVERIPGPPGKKEMLRAIK